MDMNTVSNAVIGTQTKVSSSGLSVPDETFVVYVPNYIPEISQEPDRFELGDYSGKGIPKTDLALVNGELFEVAKKQVQQTGFNSNAGLFQTT